MSRKISLPLLALLFVLTSTQESLAKDTADFLGAEGAPASVVSKLSKSLRKAIQRRNKYKLLPKNSMSLAMARMTFGCANDSKSCFAQLGSMRPVKWLLHARVLPAGSRAKVFFRRINAKSGKVAKTATLIFKRTAIKTATRLLMNKMFGAPKAPKRRAAPVATRRPAPRAVARRKPPERREGIALLTRRMPPRRSLVAVGARREAPPERREPATRREAPPERREPATRREAPPARREAPPERREPATRREAPPERREPATRREAPPERRSLDAKMAARTPPERRKPDTRVAAAKRPTKPPKPSKPLWKRPVFWGGIAAGLAVAAAGGMIAFGLDAQGKQKEVTQKIQQSQSGNPINYRTEIEPLENQGRTSAIMANVFLGISAAAAVGAVVLFFAPSRAPNKVTSRTSTPLPLAKQPAHKTPLAKLQF